MGYKSAADGITKTGKTKGKNLGDTGSNVAVQSGKGSKGATSVTGQEMRKMGRNLARAKNQSKGK
jgi:hypothetical protein